MPSDALWLHELAEADHRILNPFSDAKLLLLGRLCGAGPDTRVLDLACGKGELLCRWAQAYGSHGVGVDLSETFLAAGQARASGLDVSGKVAFVHGDAAAYQPEPGAFDVACCIGATWIGDGIAGTIELLRGAVQPDGLLLVGEAFWHQPNPRDQEFGTLLETVALIEAAGAELVELVAASEDDWDRHSAAQWRTLSDWLRAQPTDPRASRVQGFLQESRREYLEERRSRLGWAVFQIRP